MRHALCGQRVPQKSPFALSEQWMYIFRILVKELFGDCSGGYYGTILSSIKYIGIQIKKESQNCPDSSSIRLQISFR